MNIEKRYKVATLMAAIAEVPDDRFRYAGYEDKQLFAALIEIVPNPEMLARYAVDLDRAHQRGDLFLKKLEGDVTSTSGSYDYVGLFRGAYAALQDVRKNLVNAQMANALPFDDDLPSITSVMSHIEVERRG
ncbi:hypothetical protein [Mesorhizobium sp. 1M-11]|uniref:hypothetical protein n=1 Tax=Mesorhizobium sp. 1M-11 TaxID=1529006 RepID=UPI000AD6E348|nr:hypothetical protein [Mesorhizobium sp. 1M-11]